MFQHSQNEKTKAMQYIIRRVRCSVLLQKHSRMTPNESKNRQKSSTCSSFNATYMYFLKRFGVRMLENVQESANS